MNILALIGILLGFAGVIFGYVEDEGVLSALVKIPALSIVFGGTFGIVLAANPLSRLKKIPAAIKLAFFSKRQDSGELVELLVGIAVTARKSGLLVLEEEAKKIENPLLKKGMSYVADGVSPEYLKHALEVECDALLEDYEDAAKVFEGMGGSAPTMGVLGTVMGMVSILRDMDADMASLGGKIATAFIATMYGVGSANLLWLPIAAHIKAATEVVGVYNRIVIEGLVMIQEGEYPTRINELLLAMCGSTLNKKSGAGINKEKGGTRGKATE